MRWMAGFQRASISVSFLSFTFVYFDEENPLSFVAILREQLKKGTEDQ